MQPLPAPPPLGCRLENQSQPHSTSTQSPPSAPITHLLRLKSAQCISIVLDTQSRHAHPQRPPLYNNIIILRGSIHYRRLRHFQSTMGKRLLWKRLRGLLLIPLFVLVVSFLFKQHEYQESQTTDAHFRDSRVLVLICGGRFREDC
jgi:hypothetical protein